jgi:hypothetical protein
MRPGHLFALLALVGGCSKKDGDETKARVTPASGPVERRPTPPAPLPDLAPTAPQDRLTTITAERANEIARLTIEAKKTYPDAKARYLKGLPADDHFFVVVTLISPGAKETVFVAVSAIADGKITGTIASDIATVAGYHAGDAYTVAEDAIVDWVISKADGTEEGNLVGKYLDTQH